MDFGSQKFSDDINISFIIHKLLVQQKKDREKHKEKFYPFVPQHNKSISLPENNNSKNERICSDYTRMKRTVYDHTKSLRHYDVCFSISTVLTNQVTKPLQSKSQIRAKNKSIQIRKSLNEAKKQTENILKRNLNSPQKPETKISRGKLYTRQNKNLQKILVDIPKVRAQTIIPCPRRNVTSSMVDQEITTDCHGFFPNMM